MDKLPEDYESCAARLIKNALSNGNGQMLRDVKVLMDTKDEAVVLAQKFADKLQGGE